MTFTKARKRNFKNLNWKGRNKTITVHIDMSVYLEKSKGIYIVKKQGLTRLLIRKMKDHFITIVNKENLKL